MTRDERVGAAALGTVGGLALLVAAANAGGGSSAPAPQQTRTVREVRVMEPTTVYRGDVKAPEPAWKRQQQHQSRRMLRWANHEEPDNAWMTPKSVNTAAVATQTTATQAPATQSSAAPALPSQPAQTATTQSAAPASSSATKTAAQRHVIAMKGVATKCLRQEITAATCARDHFPFG